MVTTRLCQHPLDFVLLAQAAKPAAMSVTLYVCHHGACQVPAVGYDDANMAIRVV